MITLPYPPGINNMYANRRSGRGGRIKSAKAVAYKTAAGLVLRSACVEKLVGDVKLVIRLYRPQRSGDVDGRLKAILDALTGIAYEDDKQVSWIDVRRFEDKHNPRVELLVQMAD